MIMLKIKNNDIYNIYYNFDCFIYIENFYKL